MTQTRNLNASGKMGGLRLPEPRIRLERKLTQLPNGCRVVTKSITNRGYGLMTINGKRCLTHRMAWEFAYGPIPDGLVVCHKCDNRPCCNPEHLFLGTIADNNRDMWNKGRGVHPEWKRRPRKVPTERLPEMYDLYMSGVPKSIIADRLGVTRQAVHYLLKRDGYIAQPE